MTQTPAVNLGEKEELGFRLSIADIKCLEESLCDICVLIVYFWSATFVPYFIIKEPNSHGRLTCKVLNKDTT